MSVLVWAVYGDRARADAGIEQLIEASFPPDEIKVVMKTREGVEDVPMERKTAAPAGAAIGATLGAAGAAGAVLLTGGGALIAAGPILGLLQAAGIGGALGGIAGAMGGLGWWKDEADLPEQVDAEQDARVLILIPVPEGREDEAREAVERTHPERSGTVDDPEQAARVHGTEALAEDAEEQQGEQRRERHP